MQVLVMDYKITSEAMLSVQP